MRAFLFVALFALTAHAELYRWTDESGQVHFGDQPPADHGAQALEEKAPPRIGQGEEVHRIHQRAQETHDTAHQRERERQAKTEQEKREADVKKKRCDYMRKRISRYDGRVYNSERNAFLTDEELASERKKMQGWINENCGDG